MNRKILIGGAWPYANGSLHIGHVAGLLPGDVLARYFRAAGDEVCYVSGSDCHGTPVSLRAQAEGAAPEEISGRYHREFQECFRKLGFSYDEYGSTMEPAHRSFVTEFHRRLYQSPYVYEKESLRTYCEKCGRFLADRFVEGVCPHCGEWARGDQCDACGAVLEPEHLKQPKCTVCGEHATLRASKHLYLSLGKLRDKLQALVDEHPGWRENAISLTGRYLKEGLRDRALTRDLDWGIPVPKEGYEMKKIYIWAENVLGYLSMSAAAAQKKGFSFEELWSRDKEEDRVRHYYVHAKDNIPFHTIILPALLLAEGSGFRLPDRIISNEYMTLEGRKVSTSHNWAVWIRDIADRFQPDALRYFFIANGPEKRDTDFTMREFVRSVNGELLGAYGNFVNRTLTFIYKYLDAKVPEGQLPPSLQGQLPVWYAKTGRLIEEGQLKKALFNLFTKVRSANKYFDERKPWLTRKTDPVSCCNTLYTCVQLIANLAALLAPFLPFSSERIGTWLGTGNNWSIQSVPAGRKIPEPEVLFERLEEP